MSDYLDHLLSLLLTAEFRVCLVVVVTSHDRQTSRGNVSSQRPYVTAADDDNKDVDDETDEDGEQQDAEEDDTSADEPVCLLVVHSGCLGSVLVRAADWQLEGCKFDSQPPRCRVTTLGKLFTPMCLCGSLLSSGSMPGCGVRGHGQLCLSRQPLQCTALGTGCAPLLQCLCQLSLPPSVGWQNESTFRLSNNK